MTVSLLVAALLLAAATAAAGGPPPGSDHPIVVSSSSAPLPPRKTDDDQLPTGWTMKPEADNVGGRAKPGADASDIRFLGTFASWGACVGALKAANASKGPFHSITWYAPPLGLLTITRRIRSMATASACVEPCGDREFIRAFEVLSDPALLRGHVPTRWIVNATASASLEPAIATQAGLEQRAVSWMCCRSRIRWLTLWHTGGCRLQVARGLQAGAAPS